ncbi:hypothetical protein [Micromonospora avicenniae]|uniref:Uncharacterized protein n=1 Tax=Micromonospora avicenniae TaxID=1198245 RepID=A0A1N6PSS1_9ACTN|nr:hypothetical protein [Micromonospora avicenniae]SIQ07302.1 hypothetical protein SAMN05444858_1017 [Micromonospora avicenniae]
MGSLDGLIRDLRGFEGRKEVLKHLRKEIRQPLPSVRAAIKRRALDTLPRRGGLNVWVSRTKITVQTKLAGRAAGVRMKGSRKSAKDKSDLKRLDAGKVRAPSWGRRGAGAWHTQQVEPGYFTKPATEIDQWRAAANKAVDEALEVIRRG